MEWILGPRFSIVGFPKMNATVTSTGDELHDFVTIPQHVQGVQGSLMVSERESQLARRNIPDLDRPISTGGE